MQPFIAEIDIFSGNFAPFGWAQCNGQLMSISQNTALFSLLGTTYGGDGKSTFGLPNLQGRAPMHAGQGTGLTFRDLGEPGGESDVTLLTSEMPSHTHAARSGGSGGLASPSGNSWGSATKGHADAYTATGGSTVNMNATAIGLMGGSQPHNNLMPYLVLNFCIALVGIFPQRS